MPAPALYTLSASVLSAAYRQGQLSPVAVTEAVLAHIARCEPTLHAFYRLQADRALAAAQASARRWQRGQPLSALDGVPVTLKENIATAGDPTPLGTAAGDLTPATADAPPAARLREAGAVLLGKTTMPDYGMLSSGLSSLHPAARNPWQPALTPGGSSAGAGAAAAAGYGPLHVGTDIGGSIRLPAGWCGVVGFKPSLGRVPIDPPYMGRVAGPMTRSVADAALLMQVLARPDARDSMALPPQALDWSLGAPDLGWLRGLRIGLLLDAGCGLPLVASHRDAVVQAAERLARAGARIEPMAPFMTAEMLDGLDRFWRMRSHLDLAALPAERRARVLPFIQAWADSAAGMGGAEVFRAFSQSHLTRTRTVQACAGLDYVLSPVSPVPAFGAEQPCPTNDPLRALEHIGFTVPFNMSEQPAIALPGGFTPEGLPIGLQIAGQRFDDLGVLRLAHSVELLLARDGQANPGGLAPGYG